MIQDTQEVKHDSMAMFPHAPGVAAPAPMAAAAPVAAPALSTSPAPTTAPAGLSLGWFEDDDDPLTYHGTLSVDGATFYLKTLTGDDIKRFLKEQKALGSIAQESKDDTEATMLLTEKQMGLLDELMGKALAGWTLRKPLSPEAIKSLSVMRKMVLVPAFVQKSMMGQAEIEVLQKK
jgi:hypothetical protein